MNISVLAQSRDNEIESKYGMMREEQREQRALVPDCVQIKQGGGALHCTAQVLYVGMIV